MVYVTRSQQKKSVSYRVDWQCIRRRRGTILYVPSRGNKPYFTISIQNTKRMKRVKISIKSRQMVLEHHVVSSLIALILWFVLTLLR